MKLREYALAQIRRTQTGSRLLADKRYAAVTKAVFGLIGNLAFAFYNGILGVMSSSLIFVASSVYYLLLSTMRFCVVVPERKNREKNDGQTASRIGGLLIVLSVIFHIMVLVSIKNRTATMYGTIPMITIAVFTFTKITMAAITAGKHRKDPSPLFKAVNAIRYSEVAVSLLTMQQSMLVSFEGMDDRSSVILNGFTGAGVCFFILALGILTLKNGRKEREKWQNPS